MRVARMPIGDLPHVTKDTDTGRWQYKRRWLSDIKAKMSTTRFVRKCRKGADETAAMSWWLAAHADYDREVAEARGQDPDLISVGKKIGALQTRVLKAITAELNAEIAEIDRQDAENRYDLAVLRAAQLGDVAAQKEFAARYGITSDRKSITTDRVIDYWVEGRTAKNDAPGPDTISRYRSVIRTMLSHLQKEDDFTKLTKLNISVYAEDLERGKVESTAKNRAKPHPKTHLEIIRTMCRDAVRIAARDGWEMASLVPDLRIAGSNGEGVKFTTTERLAVLSAARNADPVVKWSHFTMAYTGAYPTELMHLRPGNVVVIDGFTVLDIKPLPGSKLKSAWRPRRVLIPQAVIREGFLDYVETIRQEHGEDAPLFPTPNADDLGTRINDLIRDMTPEQLPDGPIMKRSKAHRHYVATELEGFLEPDEKGRVVSVSKYVCGHSRKDGSKHSGYVHIEPHRQVLAIESMEWPV